MGTVWTLVVNIMLPPPLVLVTLLLLPLPTTMRKGILRFTDSFLSVAIANSVQLVHLMIGITGLCLIATTSSTVRLARAVHDMDLTPNKKSLVLGKKWREERNFWIAALTFMLWCILSQLYKMGLKLVKLLDENKQLKEELVLERQAPGAARPAGEAAAGAAGADELRKRK